MDAYGRPVHPRQTQYSGSANSLQQEYQRPPQTVVLQKPYVPHAIMIVHVMVVLSVLLVFVWADHEDTTEKYLGGLNLGSKLFNWHPVFMTWGFSCMIEGALCYRSLRFTPHRRKRTMHGTWLGAGVVLLCCGLAVVFSYKHEQHLASLYSTHSWLGIFTVTLVFAQFVLGFGTYALPGACVSLTTKQAVYPWHASLGLASTVFAGFSVISGLDHENTLLGCAYSVVNKDLNPALHYSDIPAGCRVSNGIAVMVMVTLLLSVYALTNLKSASAHADSLKLQAAANHANGTSAVAGGVAGGVGGGSGLREDPESLYYGTQHLSDYIVAPGGGRGPGSMGSSGLRHPYHAAPVHHREGGGHPGGGVEVGAQSRPTVPDDSISALESFEEPTAQLSHGGEDDEYGIDRGDSEASRLLS